MTHLLRELQNTDNLESIHEIQFSLFSHQDIKRGSVADILTPETYDSNVPKNNGLFEIVYNKLLQLKENILNIIDLNIIFQQLPFHKFDEAHLI